MGDKVYDPWLDTAKDAHNGRLTIAPDVAGDAAAYAADCAASLSAAQGYTHLLTQYTGFSDNGMLHSALTLRDRFAAQGGQMGTIIAHYLDLVNAMGDTFVTAGKLYKSKDEDAATAFDAIKRDAVARWDNTGIPLAGATQIPSWPTSTPDPNDGNGNGDMATVSQAKSGRYTDAIGSEDPTGHDPEWFLAVGQGINPQPIADISGLWGWMADHISSDFQLLSGRIKQMTAAGSWTGKGAAGAVKAAAAFEAQAADLSTDLHAIAENLLYTSGWLNLTKAGMPIGWDGDKLNGSAEETRVIQVAVAAFKSWYIPGIANSSTMIPKLVDPTAQPPALTDNGGSTTSDYTGGGPTGGGPTGGGPQGTVSASAIPLLNAKAVSTPSGGGRTPGGANGSGGTDPNGSNPSGSNPSGSNPGGSNPDGSNPSGTDSGGSNQGSSSPSSSDSSQSGLSQLQSAMQSGMQGLQSAQSANQQNLQNQLQNSPLGSLPNLLNDLKTPLGANGVGGGGGGPKLDAVQPAKLFPRAAAIAGELEAESVGVARAGLATGPASAMGGGGMGGGMGHGAGGHGNQGKEHKRLEALESTEYLDEAMGTAPIVAKPVVEG
ncbi:hypothetical protein [Nocardia sp. NBC_00511]|uniref:hypothetical protein n=1 Tax=Nocardia sp. NBC_00511 TaxID=2903591 RepID=UPI0030E2B872